MSSRPMYTWFAVVGIAMGAALVGCERVGPPTTEEEAHRGELTERKSQVFGSSVADIPDDGLKRQGGEPFRWRDVVGRPLILSAIYTNCPKEKMCPMLTSKIGDAQQILMEETGLDAEDFTVVLFTFDPERDTPEKLTGYAEARGLELENTVAVSGDSEAIERVMDSIEVGATEEEDGVFMHNLRTYVVDAEGTVQYGFTRTDWRPKDLAARVKTVLR